MKQFLYILTVLFGVLVTQAQNDVLFSEANTLYNAGKYAEAIDKYETILKSDVHSAELYFNLANAHYKLNNVAPTVYYYEKALLLNPTDTDIKNNIGFAKNMTVDAIDTIPQVGFSKLINAVTKTLSADGWAILAIFFTVCFVVLILVYYFSIATTPKRIAFLASMLSLFGLGIALIFAFSRYNLDTSNNPAIVFAQETQVKTEPNLRSEEAFKLHEGTKVNVIDTIGNWKEIKLTDGKTGWISAEDIKLIKDF
jgi:tetratricopeptide (TPR) repeat protein